MNGSSPGARSFGILTWWSCGFPTAQLCSLQPHPQLSFNDMRQYGFGVLVSPDSFRTLACIRDRVWLHQTRIIRLEDFWEECGEGVVMSIINVKYTIRMLNMFHLRAESPLRDVWIKRYNLNVCSQETAPLIKCTKL